MANVSLQRVNVLIVFESIHVVFRATVVSQLCNQDELLGINSHGRIGGICGKDKHSPRSGELPLGYAHAK